MLWTEDIASFVSDAVAQDGSNPLAESIRTHQHFERMYEGEPVCECCNKPIPNRETRLAFLRTLVRGQLREYASEVLGLTF